MSGSFATTVRSARRSCYNTCIRPQIQAQCHNRRIAGSHLRRNIHSVPVLKHDATFRRDGVPNLLSPAAYKVAWQDYQQLMVDRLNAMTEGYAEANETPKALTLNHARDPQYAALFNHASMAWNNHFYFDSLAGSSSNQGIAPGSDLHSSLVSTFGSIEDLRETMIEMAYTMFGPGCVWLVWNRATEPGTQDAWRLLPTYLAGTPFPEAGYRQQAVDQNTAGSFGAHSRAGKMDANRAPGSARLEPVLCVNTWQHVWLHDYGVAGKREYLQRWWDAIDWHQVQTRAPPNAIRPGGGMRNYSA